MRPGGIKILSTLGKIPGFGWLGKIAENRQAMAAHKPIPNDRGEIAQEALTEGVKLAEDIAKVVK